jgi:hypothetical protein
MDARIAAAGCMIAALVAAPPVRADIYTWIDASGRLNVSNLDPPAGVDVVRVDRTAPPKPPPPAPARDEALAALSDRVAALQDELARRDATPRVIYAAPPPDAPTFDASAYDAAPAYPAPAIQQWISVYGTAPPPAAGTCDPSWWGCAYGWGAYGYPGVIVVPAMQSHGIAKPPHRRPPHAGNPIASPRPPSVGPVPPPFLPPSMHVTTGPAFRVPVAPWPGRASIALARPVAFEQARR